MEFLKLAVTCAAIAQLSTTSCQKYDNPYDPQNADKDFDGDGIANKDDPYPKDATKGVDISVNSGGTTSSGAASYALSFTHLKIDYWEEVYSAIFQDGKFYLFGKLAGSSSSYKLGTIDATEAVTKYSPANFSVASGIEAFSNSTKFELSPTGEANQILLNNFNLNTATWTVTKTMATDCLPDKNSAYSNYTLVCARADGRLHKYGTNSSDRTCGLEDGNQIGDIAVVTNSSGDKVDMVPMLGASSCGDEDSTLIIDNTELTVYNRQNDMSVKYSLSTYPFTAVAVFAADAGYIIVGCDQDEGTCYKSTATVVTQ